MYAYVNRILSPKPNFGPLYSHTDPNTLLHIGTDKANAFNNYFHSVFSHDNMVHYLTSHCVLIIIWLHLHVLSC